MDINQSISSAQAAKIGEAFKQFPGLMRRAVKKAFQQHGRNFIRSLVKERLSGGANGLHRRTGSLARSFNTHVLEQEGKMTLVVFTTSKYAAMQEFGGTQVPKKAKYLAIPMDPAKTSSGAPRYAGPRQVPGLKYMVGKSGKPFLGKKEGGSIVAYYLLRKSVLIPARMRMTETWAEKGRELPPFIVDVAREVLDSKYKRIS